MNTRASETIKSMVATLTAAEKREIFDLLTCENTYNDIAGWFGSEYEDLTDEDIEKIAEIYVYDGKYKTESSLWEYNSEEDYYSSLRNLIEAYIKEDTHG